MKSMKKMQDEILSQARWDGGYPKAVHMGLGIIALAHSKEEEERMNRETMQIHIWGLVVPIIISPLLIWFIDYLVRS